jgi:peroxiredoxin
MAWRTKKLLGQGAHAPEFRLQRLEGAEVELRDLTANGPVLLVFYKITCPVCQMTLPFLERIHTAGRLSIVALSQNDADDTREFNRRYRISIPTLLDSEDAGFPASNAYGISSVPTMFLVERDGTVAQVIEGWQKAEIERLGTLAGMQPFRPDDNVPQWKAG